MKRFKTPDINTPEYWDSHQTATDFGLRQKKYKKLAGHGQLIIDFGCGLSPFLNGLGENFTDKWGIDFSNQTVKNCRRLFPDCYFLCCSVVETPFNDKYFDVSVSGEVIEHLTDPLALIKEMARVTKRRIIISTPHLEFEDPEHLWEFEPGDIMEMLKPYGRSQVTTINSELFPGRQYMFGGCDIQ